MIARYTPEEIGKIWTDENKFNEWLNTELAVIKTREDSGEFPKGTYKAIKEQVTFTVQRIKEVEEETQHDLVAFVRVVCESIESTLQQYVHKDITSYDTEEPAQARQVIFSLDLIITAAKEVYKTLLERAVEFRNQKVIGRTHAKKAQFKILGLYFLTYADMIDYVIGKLEEACEDMKYSKISGAVGCYNRALTPELEEGTLAELGLKPVKIATQIVQRHRMAYAVLTVSLLGAVLNNIAWNFWLWIHREIADEPFRKKQTGSSAMPHKINAITCERIMGLGGRSLVNKALPALQNVVSLEDRDIAHSSVERTEIKDAFILGYYLLLKAKGLIRGLVIYPSWIEKEIREAYKLVFSERVKSFLEERIDKKLAYEIVQSACLKAKMESCNLDELLLGDERFLSAVPEVAKAVRLGSKLPKEFTELFNEDPDLKFIDTIYARFGL